MCSSLRGHHSQCFRLLRKRWPVSRDRVAFLQPFSGLASCCSDSVDNRQERGSRTIVSTPPQTLLPALQLVSLLLRYLQPSSYPSMIVVLTFARNTEAQNRTKEHVHHTLSGFYQVTRVVMSIVPNTWWLVLPSSPWHLTLTKRLQNRKYSSYASFCPVPSWRISSSSQMAVLYI